MKGVDDAKDLYYITMISLIHADDQTYRELHII
jgi:hypothetical protein